MMIKRTARNRPRRSSSDSGDFSAAVDFSFFESLPIAAFIFDDKTRKLVAANKVAFRQYGWVEEEIVGMSLQSLFVEEGESISEEPLNTRHQRKDGSLLDVQVTVRSLGGKSSLRVLYVVDETEKKELETRFLRAQRLECIGTLASGVAHDLNNVLAPIMMSASMLREELPPEVRQEFLEAIEQSAQRGVNLLKQVLTFARGVEGKRVPLRPEALIQEVADLARRTFPKLIQIRTRVATGLWEIEGDATRLHQVILNLVVNARDAMEAGGILSITAKNKEVTPAQAARIPGASPGCYVALGIQDTGCGISKEMLRNIFTPFFTTKQPGRGTGLGLPTVISIVKSHGGFLEVKSGVGKGSTFTIYFPIRPVPVVPIASAPSDCSILVVDDDPGIRKMVKAVLIRHGYKVTLAESGEEGLAEFLRRPKNFGMALVDIVMPGMDGIALSKAMKEADPNVVIVASSGIDHEAKLEELRRIGVTRFLKKPYLSSQLVGLVAEMVAR